MFVLKLILRQCLHNALTQILEYHAHTLMGDSPSHTELVYTFIIIIEKALQKLSFPEFSRVFYFSYCTYHHSTRQTTHRIFLKSDRNLDCGELVFYQIKF